ncbi:DUF488 domain-containing protein [Methanolobus mangrovi]|uniref:DUF488 domain-containing protein n=1 Tax=Methanolobus mangrovi TaxID=3072977 RepID=A0AA51UKD3_9EURY|nr:DUF488 domain-containing protein [Methanolobus mangrovi]WMW23306.1 DUF488 domain-containing protein [Methanolobus mangrovi]
MKCYTIGYGNRHVNDFIGMLIENKVTHLVDIRRYPQSTFKDYDKESLELILPKNGIIYSHSEGVGGMRDSTYVEYMQTDSFRSSFSKLMDLIREVNEKGGRLVLMCAEKSPKSCHRQYLSVKLEENGIEVIHLVEHGQTSLFNF